MKLRALFVAAVLAAAPAHAYDNPDMLASELIGMDVQNIAGEGVGEIEDLETD